MKKERLIAILGRGCMMEYPGGPFKPTRDFDNWDLQAPPETARPEVLAEKNDEDPNSVIGGGELNIAAAQILYEELKPACIVFAYGDNGPALQRKGFAGESEVMTNLFIEAMGTWRFNKNRARVWDGNFWKTEGKASGTFNELRNIFRLAELMEYTEVVIVTIMDHMTRVGGMLAKHFMTDELAYWKSRTRLEVTESILLRADPKLFSDRIWEIFGSQSHIRELQRQVNGLTALRKGVTQTNQHGVTLGTAATK